MKTILKDALLIMAAILILFACFILGGCGNAEKTTEKRIVLTEREFSQIIQTTYGCGRVNHMLNSNYNYNSDSIWRSDSITIFGISYCMSVNNQLIN